MADATARMLRLLSLLQTHRYWSGPELADRLEITPRTLRRDIDRLRDLGYPVAASRGVGGGYQLEAGAALPPLLLDDDEAIAIAVGLGAAAGGPTQSLGDSPVRALAKVVRMLPPRLRRRADALTAMTVPVFAGGGPVVDGGTLAVLAGACQDHEQVRFSYAPRDREMAVRTVEPHRMVTVGRRWYLVAWDLDRADWRTYRVDRITDPRSMRFRFDPRPIPGGDAAAFVQDALRAVPGRFEVDVRIGAPAEVVERVVGGWGTVTPEGEDRCRLGMSVDDLAWPAMVLAAVDAPFDVVAPPELPTELARIASRFAAPGPSGSRRTRPSRRRR